MDVFAAIDVRDGRCVRLHQGDYGRETVYDVDPVAVARRYQAAGARWIHVVDLDAARTGVAANRDVVAAIAEAVAPATAVQAGGGARDVAAAEALFAVGVERVVLGTAAMEQPGLVRELAARHPVAVGLDLRDGEVMVRGWTARSGVLIGEALSSFEHAGIAAVVITDTGRDATLGGPDLVGLAGVLRATSVPVIGSGGVASLDDLTALGALETDGRRLAGVIIGSALYEHRFTLEAALAVCDRRVVG